MWIIDDIELLLRRYPKNETVRFLLADLKVARSNVERGLGYTIMCRLYFRNVVYDFSEQKMYHYEIYGLASKNQLTTAALKLHALFIRNTTTLGEGNNKAYP